MEEEAKTSKLLVVAWFFWGPAPIQEPIQSQLIGTKNAPSAGITQEITSILGALCQEVGTETNIYMHFLLLHQLLVKFLYQAYIDDNIIV